MFFPHRVFTTAALLAVTAAAGARAQDPAPAPRREFYRIPRIPFQRFQYRMPNFEYRIPHLSMRFSPRARFDLSDLGRRIQERSLDRMNRVQDLRFKLEDRAWRRQLEAQDRMQSRMSDRLDRLPRSRSFTYRRHFRTI